MRAWRFYFLFFIIILIAAAIGSRLFFLQVKNHDFYAALFQGQINSFSPNSSLRGEIFFQEKGEKSQPLAINKEGNIVYAVPKEIENPEETAQILSSILEIPQEEILEKITKVEDPYQPLKNKVSEEKGKEIKELKLKGIGLKPDNFRYYPQNTLAASLSGFIGYDSQSQTGQYGIEEFYNDELEGDWSKKGKDLILTIDYNLQYICEKELKELVEKWDAKGGTIIVSDPTTGAIKVMADFPNFDLNQYSQVENQRIFMNKSVQSLFEPGSVFKPITMAVALETGKLTPQTTYLDEGQVRVGGRVIRNVDSKSYGEQTMTEVLEKSLNTGAVFAVNQIEKDIFLDYLKNFGFSEKVGIDLVGEEKGDINNLNTFRDINYATASFGQGISITPVGLVTAFSAVANQGKMVKPYVVDEFINGNVSVKTKSQIIKEVISPTTASRITAMMVSVVENGSGKLARIPGYHIAGKTGTSQIPYTSLGENKIGYSDEVWHSFLGFAPAFNPKFLIFIKLDSPHGIRFAAGSLGPVFKRVAEYLFNYLEIPPDHSVNAE